VQTKKMGHQNLTFSPQSFIYNSKIAVCSFTGSKPSIEEKRLCQAHMCGGRAAMCQCVFFCYVGDLRVIATRVLYVVDSIDSNYLQYF
jgi:hypothetical protein